MNADISLHFRYDEKDARWRWLAEIGAGGPCRAGEERHYSDAVDAASVAAHLMLIRGEQ